MNGMSCLCKRSIKCWDRMLTCIRKERRMLTCMTDHMRMDTRRTDTERVSPHHIVRSIGMNECSWRSYVLISVFGVADVCRP